jgi:acyl transferase domain-containing protein
MNMLSVSSKCFSFDERANGYARGEGFAVIVLKSLAEAINARDTIRAVIRATGTNQDGRTQLVTQPSGDAQEDLIRETYKKAGLHPSSASYIEAHGTGTPVGGKWNRF